MNEKLKKDSSMILSMTLIALCIKLLKSKVCQEV